MSKINLTKDEINHLKETAKILANISTNDESSLADLYYNVDEHMDYSNSIFKKIADDYDYYSDAFADIGKIIQTIAEETSDEEKISSTPQVKKGIKLKELEGDHILSGVELGQAMHKRDGWPEKDYCNYVKFTIDGIHYMAFEDPNDGYRSYCEDLEIVDEPCNTRLPDIEVEVKYISVKHFNDSFWTEDCDVIQFIDKANGKLILEVGTENVGDWYPSCVFHYYPENMSCNEGR